MANDRFPAVLAGAILLLVLSVILAIGTGPYDLSPARLIALMGEAVSGQPPKGVESAVLFGIRLPRVLAAAFVGAALAGAGSAYQVTFRNPLVSPDILGVSAGAGFGAVLGIYLGLPVIAIQGLGFVIGIATVAIVMMVAALIGDRGDTLTLVLCGIAVGALAGAGIALLKTLADPDDQLPAMTFWLLGSLSGVRPEDTALILPPVLIGLIPLFLMRWRIGVLSLGEDDAQSLGVNTTRLRWIVIAAATLMTAAAVSAAGMIGWIGLMVPHMARMIAGARFDRVLPIALLLGAALLVLIDTVARSIATTEVALGILTAVIGAPVFLILLSKSRRP